MNSTSPNTLPPVVGRVEILLHADGNVSVKAEMPNQTAFLGALEAAKFAIAAKYAEAERAAASGDLPIQLPPAALVNRLNGKR